MTVTHADGLRSSVEPLVARASRVGDRGRGGRPARHASPARRSHCAPSTCLHWGVRVGDRLRRPAEPARRRGPVVLLPCALAGPRPTSRGRGAERRGVGGSDALGLEEARAQPQHRGGVHLRDAGLGDAEHATDLGEGHALVVVEDEDDASRARRAARSRGPAGTWSPAASSEPAGSVAPGRRSSVSQRGAAESPRSSPAPSSSSSAATLTVESWVKIARRSLDAASRGARRPRARWACGAARPRARRTRGRPRGPWCAPSAGSSRSRAARR